MSSFSGDNQNKMLNWLEQNIEWVVMIAFLIPIAIYIPLEIRRSREIRRRQIERETIPCNFFVTAKLLDPILPMERKRKYEAPLEEALLPRKLGVVTGGGTQMGPNNSIAWIDLEIGLANLDEALEIARRKLRESGAPSGSVLEYRLGDKKMSDPL